MKKFLKRGTALGVLATQVFIVAASRSYFESGNTSPQERKETHITIKPPVGWSPLNRGASTIDGPEKIAPYGSNVMPGTKDSKPIAQSNDNRPTADALGDFKTAATADQACMAASIDDLIKDLQKNENLTRSEAAIKIIKSMKNEQIRDLPVEARAQLVQAITAKNVDKGDPVNNDSDVYNALRKIYLNSDEDVHFALWDAQKQYELSQKLATDQTIIDARKNWRKMKDSEKIIVMRHVVDLTVLTYGAEFGMKSVPLYYVDRQENNIFGSYSPTYRYMLLNRTAYEIPENFDDTLSVTVHESLHAFHHQLSDKLQAGTLDKNHPVYAYTQFMHESYMRYLVNNGINYETYRANPTEKHAWEIEYIGDIAGKGSKADFSVVERKLKDAQQAAQDFEQQRQRELQTARQYGGTCSVIALKK